LCKNKEPKENELFKLLHHLSKKTPSVFSERLEKKKKNLTKEDKRRQSVFKGIKPL